MKKKRVINTWMDMNLEFAYRCSIQREQAHHSGIPVLAKLTRISKINAQLEIFLWQLHATCSSATCLLFLEYVKNLGKREDINCVCQFWLNRYYLPIKGFTDSCKWNLNWISQHPPVTALLVGKLCKHRSISHLQFFLQNTYWLFLSVRGEAFQTSGQSPVGQTFGQTFSWWEWFVKHHGLVLKILAKLFANSFFMEKSFTPILNKAKKM